MYTNTDSHLRCGVCVFLVCVRFGVVRNAAAALLTRPHPTSAMTLVAGPRVSNVTFFNHGGRLGPRVSNMTFLIMEVGWGPALVT